MTKKSTDKTDTSPTMDDEACRRLMISLYGSEAAAVAAAQALAQELTPEEEALVRQIYEADNEIARQVAREVGPPDEPETVATAGAAENFVAGVTSTTRGLVEKWRGLLSDMVSLQPASDMGFARLSAQEAHPSESSSQGTRFGGVQQNLTDLCDAAALREKLSWARGVLHVGWEKSKDSRIIAIHGSIERATDDTPSESSIVLRFVDRNGAEESLELRHDQVFAIAQNPSLAGSEADIGMIFYVRTNE